MKFKFLTWAMMLGMLTLGVASCDDDDDDEPTNNQQNDKDTTGENDQDSVKAHKVRYSGLMTVVYDGDEYPTDSILIYATDSADFISLDFQGVKFVPQMPVTLDISVPNIPCKMEGGVMTFQADSIVPTMKGVPMPKYMARRIKGEIVREGIKFSLLFGDYPTSYDGKEF